MKSKGNPRVKRSNKKGGQRTWLKTRHRVRKRLVR